MRLRCLFFFLWTAKVCSLVASCLKHGSEAKEGFFSSCSLSFAMTHSCVVGKKVPGQFYTSSKNSVKTLFERACAPGCVDPSYGSFTSSQQALNSLRNALLWYFIIITHSSTLLLEIFQKRSKAKVIFMAQASYPCLIAPLR